MARVSLIDEDNRPELSGLIAKIRGARGGRLLNIYRMMLHSPALAGGWFELNQAVRFNTEVDGQSRELAVIKQGALLVNVSQPPLVDRNALLDALASGRLSGFGLDTFYEEPGQADDPLLGFRNVIVTPHLGGSPRFNALGDFEELLLKMAQGLEH